MKCLRQYIRGIIKEAITMDIEIGDIVLTGKFKNKRTIVKSIGKDEYGHPTINGKSILKFKIEKQLPKKKWSAKSREELNEGLIKEGTEFRTLDSPLTYSRAGNVKRIAYCDSSVTEPPSQRDQYFKEWERWRKYSKGGKRLKKPKLEEIVPGVSDVCIIGFLDYHQAAKNPDDGSTYWYIDYMKTRGDSQGRGVASKLIDQFYETVAQPGDNVHFGKMMREEIGHLKDKMKDKYPEIDTIGAVYY